VWKGAGLPLDDETLRIAVREWLHDPATAEVQYGHISDWDTSQVRDMSHLFADAVDFNQPIRWNTSQVENMRWMFLRATAFNQPLQWDTSKVENMQGMFADATAFNQPLSWDARKFENMAPPPPRPPPAKARLAPGDRVRPWDWEPLEPAAGEGNGRWRPRPHLPLPTSWAGTRPSVARAPWDTSKVRDMQSMFIGATAFNQPLEWDTRKVKNMKSMFAYATAFNQPLEWNTLQVEDMKEMFFKAPLMIRRYPDGKLPMDRWGLVRYKFMNGVRRGRQWHWQATFDDQNVPVEVLRGWADELGIPLHECIMHF